jgi:large subunit ribosomal protein L21
MTMFAVLKTGGKQYRVQAGDILRVEKLAADAGEKVQFNEVVGSTVGTPMIEGAAVQADVVDQIKGDKVINFVKRRRKHSSKRTKGHRQQLTLVKVTEILEKGGDKSGVKAAIGAGSVAGVAVAAAAAKPAKKAAPKKEAPKAEPKAEKKAEPKAAPKKAAPKKAAATGADDLKRISGVGPALEKKLHDLGVTTFAQIAAWGPDEIAEMDDKLSFKGRIERDEWLKQAAEFVAEKE